MTTNIRKTSNVFPIGKSKSVGGAKSEESTTAASPFAVNPTDTLKSLTERKSRELTEEQRLALLQRALQDFSQEARSHLPLAISEFERKMHQKMLEEGFPDVVANEAGEEVVDALLENRRITHVTKKA